MNKANDWTFAETWTKALEQREERIVEPRDRMWATELGKAPLDTFLKMKGVVPTNPPNARALRKFEAGNVFEWLVSLVLKRAGVLQESQKWTRFEFPGLVPVTGKIDFIAGGNPDYEHWREGLEALELPEIFLRATEQIMAHFKEKYPDGLADMMLEIKSVSAFMMNGLEVRKTASRPHRLQLKHYLKSENYPIGKVVYICRDDLRMMEIPVLNSDEATEKEYRESIETLSRYYLAHKDTPVSQFLQAPPAGALQWKYNAQNLAGLPPLETPIVFDEDLGKFARNWNVEYSSYLTMLYGYVGQLEFEEAVMPTVGRWNRVMGRIKRADKMTDKNKDVIVEMQRAGFDPAALVLKFAGEAETEETTN